MAIPRSILFKLDESKIKKILYNDKIMCKAFDKQLSYGDRNRIFEKVLKYNKFNTNLENTFIKQKWSLQQYNKEHLPTVIGQVNKKMFSKRDNKYLWVMDMPIKLPFSQICIPNEFSQFTDFFKTVIQFEKMINPNFDQTYAYLCIDQRQVEPNGFQRRPGWHADSFITKNTHLQYNENFSPVMDTVYLAYDCLATEFNKGPFSFPKSVDNHSNDAVLQHFESSAKSHNIITFPNHTILKMDPCCVHRVQMNNTNFIIDRTFIKLTFTTEIFNRLGNDHNKLFDYNWPLFQRGMERNNSSLFNGFFDESQYISVDKDKLMNIFKNNNIYDMFEKQIYKIKKIGSVHIKPSYEGELLLTKDTNNDFITHNIAKQGDYKITNLNNGTQYFLPMKKVLEFYNIFNISNGIIEPKNITAYAIKVKKHIKILAPWNSFQYCNPGDFIIKKNNDIYLIKQSDFVKCYQLIV
jgi:hypothetical protein